MLHAGDLVRFAIADTFVPQPGTLLAELTAEVEISGVLVEFSDSGPDPSVYAVVELSPDSRVVVAVAALKKITESREGAD
jgi:hypothetical protein